MLYHHFSINDFSRFAWRLKYTLRGACLMLDSQEVYSRERKLRATFKNHLNSAHLQKVSNTLLQDLVKLPTLQPAYTVNGSKGFPRLVPRFVDPL